MVLGARALWSAVPRRPRLRDRFFPRSIAAPGFLLISLTLSLHSSLAQPQPYLNHRERPLAYSGPEGNLANSTEIRIVYFGPTNASASSADIWWGVQRAVSEANAKGVCAGRRVRLIPCWVDDIWRAGAAHLARTIYSQDVLAVIGGPDSASTHLAEQIVAKANLPLISPVASDPSITLAGVPWVFSIAPSDQAMMTCLADALLGSLDGNNRAVALLTTTDHQSRMAARELIRVLGRRGKGLAFRLELQPGAVELSPHAEALRNAAPQDVVVIASVPDSVNLVRMAKEVCPQARIFGGRQFGRTEFVAGAADVAESAVFPLLYQPMHGGDSLSAAFESKQNRSPDFTVALAYDATKLLLAAIDSAGPNRAAVRKALIARSPYPGLAGLVCFDGTGQNATTNVTLGTIRSGKVVPYVPRKDGRSTVYGHGFRLSGKGSQRKSNL